MVVSFFPSALGGGGGVGRPGTTSKTAKILKQTQRGEFWEGSLRLGSVRLQCFNPPERGRGVRQPPKVSLREFVEKKV